MGTNLSFVSKQHRRELHLGPARTIALEFPPLDRIRPGPGLGHRIGTAVGKLRCDLISDRSSALPVC